jgi:predicted regulator of Ras-like GTPase activity (Roadblock/LC7/MglB family)
MTRPIPLPPNAASESARDLSWLLTRLVEEVPGLLSVAVVSADGLPLLSSETADQPSRPIRRGTGTGTGTSAGTGTGPGGSTADLATVVSGLGSLTGGAASLMAGGAVRQTLVAMDTGNLLVMSISDGSLLGVYTSPEADMGMVTYHMALFVGRAGHLLTPRLRAELRGAALAEPPARMSWPPPPRRM